MYWEGLSDIVLLSVVWFVIGYVCGKESSYIQDKESLQKPEGSNAKMQERNQ